MFKVVVHCINGCLLYKKKDMYILPSELYSLYGIKGKYRNSLK